MTAHVACPARDGQDVLFASRCTASDAAVGATLARLQGDDALGRLDPARVADLVIVLGEVLNNTVEHALAGRDDGWIDLVVRRAGGRLEVETRDDGRPLPPALLAGGTLPQTGASVEDMPEGGFGWFIIHSLVDDMTYEREAGVNHLSFSF